MQRRVLGLVHDTHPTPAELLDDAVVRDGLVDHSQECYGEWRGMSMSSEAATSASRTPLWLLSGWGFRGRRLSKRTESPGIQPSPWRGLRLWQKRGQDRDGRGSSEDNSG